jgi:hypothetical protein
MNKKRFLIIWAACVVVGSFPAFYQWVQVDPYPSFLPHPFFMALILWFLTWALVGAAIEKALQ